MERRQSSRLLRLLAYRFCSCANVRYALLVWVADRPVSLARLTIASTLILYLRRVQGSQEAYPYGAKRSQSRAISRSQPRLLKGERKLLLLLQSVCCKCPALDEGRKHIWQIPPTERLRKPLILLRYIMNEFLASNGNGFIASNPNGFLSICARAQEPLPLFCRWLRLLHFLQIHLCDLPFA